MSDEVLDLMNWDEPGDELDRLAYAVIGAAIEVHRRLGPGFLESVYHRAMFVELKHRGLRCVVDAPVAVLYRNENVGTGKIDLLVEDKLIVELKVVDEILPIHRAQVISYLKAAHLTLGLLINFNVRSLKEGVRRIISS